MAYRRRQGMTRAATFTEDIRPRPPPPLHEDDPPHLNSRSHSFSPSSSSLASPSSSSSSSSLAAQAIKASAAHRDSSLSSAYAHSTSHSSSNHSPKVAYDMRNSNVAEESSNFWGVLAKKAKSLLDDEPHEEYEQKYPINGSSINGSSHNSSRKVDNPKLRKSLDAFTSSLNHIGGKIENAFEEGRTKIENKTADIIQETRRLQIRRNNVPNFDDPSYSNGMPSPFKNFNKPTQQHMMTSHEDKLKAARDVAMATAAKAKVLLRELKTVKADLAFAKERSSQLEDENKVLREACEKGGHPADDDMIRLQLETLLAEKARLAHENSVYARENRFLREIVEYHQLTMQDVVYLDEGIEEVTEVYPIPAVSRRLSSASSPSSPRLSHDEISLSRTLSSSHIAQIDSKDYQQTKSPKSSNSSPTPPMTYSNIWH